MFGDICCKFLHARQRVVWALRERLGNEPLTVISLARWVSLIWTESSNSYNFLRSIQFLRLFPPLVTRPPSNKGGIIPGGLRISRKSLLCPKISRAFGARSPLTRGGGIIPEGGITWRIVLIPIEKRKLSTGKKDVVYSYREIECNGDFFLFFSLKISKFVFWKFKFYVLTIQSLWNH